MDLFIKYGDECGNLAHADYCLVGLPGGICFVAFDDDLSISYSTCSIGVHCFGAHGWCTNALNYCNCGAMAQTCMIMYYILLYINLLKTMVFQQH